MFALRALTAAVLLAAFFAAVFLLDPLHFAALVTVIVALGAHEWARLSGWRGAIALAYAGACALTLVVAMAVFRELQTATPIWAIALLFWLLAVPVSLARGIAANWRGRIAAAGFIVLVPAGLAAATLPPGLLLALLGLVWIADTAAYLAGRAFGRRRLAPTVSPGKTWEGVAGGALGALAYAIILSRAMPEVGRHVAGAAWIAYLGGVTMLCALSVLGDLFESAVKRRAGVKDSGALLPGHGGVLDRIDSATAVLPAGAFLIAWSGVA
ncbi:MAG: hypothetical protein A3I63_01760 [Betaproteobacteria bacterium RIFCSPLOWO2_02_FULL_66_14]|nr:MAG: hypothetical protein A3I63_01760 [Betaproteobacteria bacterium RIFCSPLOWO2_02_FULL_66_14]